MMYLKKGVYLFGFKPVNCFELYHGSEVYHRRQLPTLTSCFVNIMKEGDYSPSLPCTCTKVKEIDNFENIELEEPERARMRPVVIVRNNLLTGTPACIFTAMNPARIEIGKKFFSYPIQIRMFILLHEYAHLFYETEWKVDKLALKLFLQLGGNPSQAFYALSQVLGKNNPENIDRIKRLFITLKKDGHVEGSPAKSVK